MPKTFDDHIEAVRAAAREPLRTLRRILGRGGEQP